MTRGSRNALVVGVLAALLGACGPAKPEAPIPPPPAPADVDPAAWALMTREEARAQRAALMRAQIEVAQRLAGEGAGAAAATHISRVISEYYAPAKTEYARRGLRLDESMFQRASDAASRGLDARGMHQYTDELLREVDRLRPDGRDAVKPAAVKRLLQEISRQYGEGVQAGFVVNEARYQDAFGLALVTRERIKDAIAEGVAKDPARGAELQREAEALVNMFPSASKPQSPADAGELLAEIDRVELEFPGMSRSAAP